MITPAQPNRKDVCFTRADIPRLRAAYNQAVAADKSEFLLTVNGDELEFHTPYAKYLLEYLEAKL